MAYHQMVDCKQLQDIADDLTISQLESQSVTETTPLCRKDSSEQFRTQVNPKIVADAILGLSDGLTVPFALTAGLSEFGNTRIVVLGGLAELIAGAISMGLGGYVGAKSEVESYLATSRRCDVLMRLLPGETQQIVKVHFKQYEVSDESAEKISTKLKDSPNQLKAFLMKNHFDAAEPPDNQPYVSALTLAVSYFIGGFIPLIPYFLVPKDRVIDGLLWSIGIMAIVLIFFGYVKTCVLRGWSGSDNVRAGMKGAGQMLVVGSLAAGAAIGLVRLINTLHSAA